MRQGLIYFTIPGYCPSLCSGSRHISRYEQGEMRVGLLRCTQLTLSALIWFKSPLQPPLPHPSPCLGNDATQGGLKNSTSIHFIKTIHVDIATGQHSVDSPLLRLPSWMSLGWVKLTIEANHHKVPIDGTLLRTCLLSALSTDNGWVFTQMLRLLIFSSQLEAPSILALPKPATTSVPGTGRNCPLRRVTSSRSSTRRDSKAGGVGRSTAG